MDENMILAEQLRQEWKKIRFEVKKSKKLNMELFNSAFSQTYSLLSKHLADKCLDKNYISLISEAFLFANIKDDTLDNTCVAAFILTERMLDYCAFHSEPVLAEKSMIYIFEMREEIELSFDDVNDSITKLTSIIGNIYWEKLS